MCCVQAYESAGDLQRQVDEVIPLQSKLELAVNERDAAISKAELLTPRPGLRAFEGLSPEGCRKLGDALDAHRNPYCLAPQTELFNCACFDINHIESGNNDALTRAKYLRSEPMRDAGNAMMLLKLAYCVLCVACSVLCMVFTVQHLAAVSAYHSASTSGRRHRKKKTGCIV